MFYLKEAAKRWKKEERRRKNDGRRGDMEEEGNPMEERMRKSGRKKNLPYIRATWDWPRGITNGQMTERTNYSNGGVHVGLDWKILKLWDQNGNNK